MPDSIFYLVLIGVGVLYLLSVMRRRRAALAGLFGAVEGVRHGPVPGYAYMPGAALRFDPRDATLPGVEGWEPLSLETLHAGSRSRIVLNLRLPEGVDDTDAFTLMKTLARRVQQRTRAQVVAVRAEQPGGEADAAVVYAPDGRGWTGTAVGAELTAELPDREPFRMAA